MVRLHRRAFRPAGWSRWRAGPLVVVLAGATGGCDGGALSQEAPLDQGIDLRLQFPIDDLGSASCTDGVRDGQETGVDCGGGCPPCADGQPCGGASDCVSGLCSAGTCAPTPSCFDGVRNQGESDVDCGGPCPGCDVGGLCTVGNDCRTRHCKAGRCLLPGVVTLGFAAPVQYQANTDSWMVRLGDFDGDGRLDVVVYERQLQLLRGRGDGTLLPRVVIPTPPLTLDLAAADLDRDGRSDLALAQNGKVSVLFGQPAGFSAPVSVDVPDQYGQAAIADVTGDGWLDVVVAGYNVVGGVVVQGGANRALSRGPTFVPAAGVVPPQGLAAADLDGDGKAEVLAATTSGAEVFRGASKGLLAVAWSEPMLMEFMESAAFGHFDTDGHLDAAMGGIRPVIKCRLGDGKGGLGVAREFATRLPSPFQRYVVVADFDGDGWDDVAAGQAGNLVKPGAITVFLGRGDGSFGGQLDLPLPGRLYGLAAGDLDRDGRIDLVASVGEQSQGVLVLRNTSR
jgi:hypothetical protein